MTTVTADTICVGDLTVMGTQHGGLKKSHIVTAAGGTQELTVGDSGKTFFVDNSAGTHTIVAPAALAQTSGFNFKVVAAAANVNNIDITSTGDHIAGSMLTVAGAYLAHGGNRTLSFGEGGNTTAIGDWAEFHSNGLKLHANGMAKEADSMVTKS